MASSIIGRTACPECDFEAAHVKIRTDAPAGKEPLPYRYCPSCGATYYARSKAAAQALLKKTRLEQAPAAAPAPSSSEPAAVPAGDEKVDPTPTTKKRGFLEGFDL